MAVIMRPNKDLLFTAALLDESPEFLALAREMGLIDNDELPVIGLVDCELPTNDLEY
jgi:hypothetical protein